MTGTSGSAYGINKLKAILERHHADYQK